MGRQLKRRIFFLVLLLGSSLETTTVFVLFLCPVTVPLFALCLVHDDVSEHHCCGIPANHVMLRKVALEVQWKAGRG